MERKTGTAEGLGAAMTEGPGDRQLGHALGEGGKRGRSAALPARTPVRHTWDKEMWPEGVPTCGTGTSAVPPRTQRKTQTQIAWTVSRPATLRQTQWKGQDRKEAHTTLHHLSDRWDRPTPGKTAFGRPTRQLRPRQCQTCPGHPVRGAGAGSQA